jgi:hypothetical protein
MVDKQLYLSRHLILDPDLVATCVITLAATIDNFGELWISLDHVLLDAVDFGLGLF